MMFGLRVLEGPEYRGLRFGVPKGFDVLSDRYG
jgi:hypothetical protein